MLQDALDDRGGDAGGDPLHLVAPLARETCQPASCAPELVLEDAVGMEAERIGVHRASTVAEGAGSTAGTGFRFRVGAVSVKPQNMSAIPTSSPT